MGKRRELHSAAASIAFCCFMFAQTGLAMAAVRAGDQLHVTIYNAPDLSRNVTVDGAGTISLPLAGSVNILGLEPKAAAARIQHAFDPYFATRASVGVEMVSHTSSLFVSGGPSGVLKYEPGETLIAALSDLGSPASSDVAPTATSGAKSNGFELLEQSRVDLRHVAVVRGGATLGTYDATALAAQGNSGPALEAGDTISLSDKPVAVRVLGDVVTPGLAYLQPEEPLTDAISQAGGVRATAASANVVLQRDGATQTIAFGAPIMDAPAHPGDVVTVPTAPRVSVVGTVSKPGLVTLKSNFTLVDAIYEAGGPAKRADLGNVSVIHNGAPISYNLADLEHGSMKQNPQLADGDLVMVPERRGADYSQLFQALIPLLYLVPKF